MLKKTVLIFAILAFSSFTLYAQEGESNNFPRHTITIDGLSTINSLFVMALLGETDSGSLYLSTELQYEFQLTPKLSVAGRFGVKYLEWGNDSSISTFSFAPHIRFYPGANVFFLDGSIGYANFKVDSDDPSHLLIVGGKVGWRIDFGKPKGFVLEPSLGYTYAFGRAFDYGDNNFNDFLNWYVKQFFIGGFSFCLGMGAKF